MHSAGWSRDPGAVPAPARCSPRVSALPGLRETQHSVVIPTTAAQLHGNHILDNLGYFLL